MQYCLITFRSVTPAQKAESILRRAGFLCSLQRTPRWMEAQGCGYSLRIRYPDTGAVAHILKKREIAYKKVYHLKEGGAAEELAV